MVVAVAANEAVRLRLLVLELELELEFECVLDMKNKVWLHMPTSRLVHAVDLRTKGKSELRNKLVSWYFRMMGFNTLRHVGTADHLHVSISSHDRPRGI